MVISYSFISLFELDFKSSNYLGNWSKFVPILQLKSLFKLDLNNFGLSENEFSKLLTSLKNGDNTLFKTIFLSHFKDCINYLQIKYHATYDDAYDATLDTLLMYRQRLVEDKVIFGNLRYLFLQMASQHLIRMLKGNEKIVEQEVDINLAYIDDEEPFDEIQLQNLSKAWSTLNDSCKELLRLNYYNGLKLNEISIKINKGYDSVRKQKERCKDALIKSFNEITK
ncbi:MAG TPA: hypothetical protein VK169_10705 [Saprospiraceae bacterium]|nr:hypothetical protein [Saprospiraceae bacterium]